MNPAAMMAGIAMGGAIGQNMAGMMNGMMQGVNNQQSVPPTQPGTPPPVPTEVYHVAVNGQPTGPFDINTLKQMIANGSLTKDSLVWKNGMPEWNKAVYVEELKTLFSNNMPPIPNANQSEE